jgi:hypothetical protein
MKFKLKFSNKVRNIIVILLIVTIIFIVLGTINYNYQEGYTEPSGNDVPKCNDSLDNDDESNMYDNWFLKTKMVPPICPTCPYYFPLNNSSTNSNGTTSSSSGSTSGSSSGTKNDNSSNNYDVNQKIINDTYIDDSSIKQNDSSINQKLINQNDNSVNNRNDNSVNQTGNTVSTNVDQSNYQTQTQTQNKSESADNKWNNLFGNNSITFGGNTTSQPNYNTSQLGSLAGSGQTQGQNNNFGFNTSQSGASAVSTPAQAGTTERMPYSSDKKESCPPCPACERCPEPAFECKKVPNYRSSSIDNYMPIPVLNDFSRF